MRSIGTQQQTCRREYRQFVILLSTFLFQIFIFQLLIIHNLIFQIFFQLLLQTSFQDRAEAAVFKVANVPQLVQALSDAAINGEEDIIKLSQGTYVGNFIYASKEAFGLTVEGGYTSDFNSRETDPLKTVLDGNKKERVLYLYSAVYPVTLKVSTITVQNGNISYSGGGGGLFAQTTGKVVLANNCIRNNMATVQSTGGRAGYTYRGGGGACIKSFDVEMSDNIISGNTSLSEGGGLFIYSLYNYGGSSGSVKINRNSITGNNSLTSGAGGVSIFGDLTSRRYEVIFDRNTVSGNSSAHGCGGVLIRYISSTVCTSNLITGNTGGGSYSGGVSISSSYFNFSNNIVAANTSETTGGVYLSSLGNGWQFSSFSNKSYIMNNTITGNLSTDADVGGLQLSPTDNKDITLQNNILWNNYSAGGNISDLKIDGSQYSKTAPSTVNLYNNDFSRSVRGSSIQGVRYTLEDNLKAQNPQFINPENGDYRLSQTSPCVDRGRGEGSEFSTTDISGRSRVLNGNIDIGAYEYAEECDLPYHSDYHYIQWECRNSDTFYCIDIFDENRNMVHQAIKCGEGVHSFLPEELSLSPGNYHWKVWSQSAENYFTFENDTDFEGSFTVPELADYPYSSNIGFVQWGTRGDDTFYSVDIFDSDWNMLYQAAYSGEWLHNFSPFDLDLPPGLYFWKVWSPSGYGDDGFWGDFYVQDSCVVRIGGGDYSLISWSCNPDRYYCVDIFDENWNMLYQAAACGEGLGSFSPRKLNLPPGLYRWKTWTPYYVECSNSPSGCGNGGEGSFATDGYIQQTNFAYRSDYNLVQWRGGSGSCIDIYDANWNLIYKDAICNSESSSFSPKDLNLPSGNYYWCISGYNDPYIPAKIDYWTPHYYYYEIEYVNSYYYFDKDGKWGGFAIP